MAGAGEEVTTVADITEVLVEGTAVLAVTEATVADTTDIAVRSNCSIIHQIYIIHA